MPWSGRGQSAGSPGSGSITLGGDENSRQSGRGDNHALLWTVPRRVVNLSLVSRSLPRRVDGQRTLSVIQHVVDTVLRKIVDLTGKHRVLIVRRDNGNYGWEVEHWSDEPMEQCWIRSGQYPFSICSSEEIALGEALGRVEWLAAATRSAG